eukprot:GHRQ01028703.1.p1 GENE.GHRQ01028703.1~~GHRQ01028703.1.p1  ORF type:complete len:173 (+),score=15.94 GHRQ01028703.1:29-547(+)
MDATSLTCASNDVWAPRKPYMPCGGSSSSSSNKGDQRAHSSAARARTHADARLQAENAVAGTSDRSASGIHTCGQCLPTRSSLLTRLPELADRWHWHCNRSRRSEASTCGVLPTRCNTAYLVGVPHHEEVAAWARQLPHQFKLTQVGVLALIHQHVTPAVMRRSLDLHVVAA